MSSPAKSTPATSLQLVDPSFLQGASPDSLLRFTQGHILEKHRRRHVWHFLIRFPEEPERRVELLRRVVARVTSFGDLRHDRVHFSRHEKMRDRLRSVWKSPVACFFGFSAAGCAKLQAPEEWQAPAFAAGLAKRLERFGQLRLADWESHWRQAASNPFDALLIGAGGSLAPLRELQRKIEETGAEVAVEKGKVRRQKVSPHHPGQPTEHFGFVDGISQPVFFEDPKAPVAPSGSGYSPGRKLSLALNIENDPKSGELHCGSYAAFVKIEQHVDRFQQAAAALAARLPTGACPFAGVPPEEYAAWLIMGRRKDGQPLVGGQAGINDFSRSDDPDGASWPRASHAAKVNPRGNQPQIMITRRGIPYSGGRTSKDPKGLLFLSFQGDVQYFEQVFQDWCLATNQPDPGPALDPVVGQDPLLGDGSCPQRYPSTNGNAVQIGNLTTIRGGEYFYFPSLPGLQTLAEVK